MRIVYVEPPPYAGAWLGGSSFSRSICCGNYKFSASIEGQFEPVDIGERKLAGWRAITPCVITVWATSRGSKEYRVEPGDVWTTQRLQADDTAITLHDAPIERRQRLVDSAGRW